MYERYISLSFLFFFKLRIYNNKSYLLGRYVNIFMAVYTKFNANHLVNHCYSLSNIRVQLHLSLLLERGQIDI